MKHPLPFIFMFCSLGLCQAAGPAAPESPVVAEGEDVVPSPEALAALAAAQAAGDRVRACQAGLLATNVAIRSLADNVEEARKALDDLIENSPAYHDLTQRIAATEAQLVELDGRKGTNYVGRLSKNRQELRAGIAKDRRQLRLLKFGGGLDGVDADRLRKALDEATTTLTKALNTHEEVAPLLRAHDASVKVYLKAARPVEPTPPPAVEPAPPPPGSPPAPPAPPSGSP